MSTTSKHIVVDISYTALLLVLNSGKRWTLFCFKQSFHKQGIEGIYFTLKFPTLIFDPEIKYQLISYSVAYYICIVSSRFFIPRRRYFGENNWKPIWQTFPSWHRPLITSVPLLLNVLCNRHNHKFSRWCLLSKRRCWLKQINFATFAVLTLIHDLENWYQSLLKFQVHILFLQSNINLKPNHNK